MDEDLGAEDAANPRKEENTKGPPVMGKVPKTEDVVNPNEEEATENKNLGKVPKTEDVVNPNEGKATEIKGLKGIKNYRKSISNVGI